jgi:hypothetical protein
MKHENELVDAIINLSEEIKGMRKDMNEQLGELNQRVGKLEKQQATTNLELKEIRLGGCLNFIAIKPQTPKGALKV